MGYKKIDLSTWERAEKYRYFTTVEQFIISVTADIDVTDFVGACKANGLKFYTAMICAVSHVINGDEHFRMGRDMNGDPIIHDTVNPLYTDFVPSLESYNIITTPYETDPKELYRNITADREKYYDKEVLTLDNPTPNMFCVTALPWLNYSSLEMHYFNNQDAFSPVVAWGKYARKEGRLMLPLTLRIHHAACDGYHVARFFAKVEEALPLILDGLTK